MKLAPSQNNLRIEFVGLSFYGQAPLKYQYRLEGIDKEWSVPSEERSVNYARLSPGSYRFLARAINRDGISSPEPAAIEFRILPPIWQRWWFVMLSLTLVGVAVYALYRYRISRLIELERVRMRIAGDLHDEMGSGLGSIGILSGLAAEDELDEAQRKQIARKIAQTNGELGTALGEIVWTLRPGSATLEALAYHLAERGGRLFPRSGTLFSTDFPVAWPKISLSLAVRRSLLLIASESLHNAARHADASKVVLGMAAAGKRWRMWIADDGKGLPEDTSRDNQTGLGLASMKRGAEEIGADISWSCNGAPGTTVTVVFDPHAEEQRAKRKEQRAKLNGE
jgi:signal transduction histidine kinase